ncbi:hypothetical protein HPB48_021491 [Haemaphysalis longicornis]|uniref:Reverse transcriptase domain-containing protein n=1 Tax=Haemaphysalis longicornis TaxID=44386 RepID=A0A9J6GB70_HAELO|nr:hypothetical protein HPB48_021491 [Haemaphysalis longicornis]
MVFRRLRKHLEEHHRIPFNLLGFRPKLSTKYILLALYEEVIKEPSASQLRAIVAADLQKAFDNVTHEAILHDLAKTNCGTAVYNNTLQFLQSRTLSIQIYDYQSQENRHPLKGIPQEAVISPTLFTLPTLKIHRALKDIKRLLYLLYADDDNLWVTQWSHGQIQDTPQEALDTLQTVAAGIGLCAALKCLASCQYIPQDGIHPRYI